MQIITHYKNTHVHCQDVATVSVANKLGLTIEFKQEKARDYYLEKFLKQRIPVQMVGSKTICPASDGFTGFNYLKFIIDDREYSRMLQNFPAGLFVEVYIKLK